MNTLTMPRHDKHDQEYWLRYVDVMASLQGLDLDPARRDEVVTQLIRIESMVSPLVAFDLDIRDEVAPVFRP